MSLTVSQMNVFAAKLATEKETYFDRLRSWLRFLYFTGGSVYQQRAIRNLDAAHNLSTEFETNHGR